MRGIIVVSTAQAFSEFAAGSGILGLGTAMVYPTLLAAVGDVAHPLWRASAVGVYRLWRDLGYAIGALLAGLCADLVGLTATLQLTAAITFMSGVVVALRMVEGGPSWADVSKASLQVVNSASTKEKGTLR